MFSFHTWMGLSCCVFASDLREESVSLREPFITASGVFEGKACGNVVIPWTMCWNKLLILNIFLKYYFCVKKPHNESVYIYRHNNFKSYSINMTSLASFYHITSFLSLFEYINVAHHHLRYLRIVFREFQTGLNWIAQD